MTMWGGRFRSKLDPAAWALNASISFDQRLARQDVRGSLAWANALVQAGILTAEECAQICAGLRVIDEELQQGSFVFQTEDEDIHSVVERRLAELIGATAGKLHTGRSRNDQVATDLRLWLLDHMPLLDQALVELQQTLLTRAESDLEILLPGYTHLQRAQPILLGHWWLMHFWTLQRDRERLSSARARTAVLPLGSGALAGTAFPVDRVALAAALGFESASPNSLDAVADRDFVAEFLFDAALVGVHLSRLGEAVVLFSSAEFGYFELADAYATGSSLMPQKKNPDVFELARGKAGRLLGDLVGILTTLKGLPSTYDKDLQEDKVPLFDAYDTLAALLPVLAGALRSLTVYPERMRAALDPSLMATDLADYLALKGIPFRQAHILVGQVVQRAAEKGVSLDKLPSVDYQEISSAFDPEAFTQVFDTWQSLNRRNVIGGTAFQAVQNQLEMARDVLHRPL